MSDKLVAADAAHENKQAILKIKEQMGMDSLVMAFLLKECRDKKYWFTLGHDRFESFLGEPEIALSRSFAFGLIQVYELYVEKLQRQKAEILDIGTTKLLCIAPVVEEDPDEWMSKAATLGRKDLRREVNEARGLTVEEETPVERVEMAPRYDLAYRDYVKAHACIICDKAEVDPHHFPVTKGAGGEAHALDVIPLCRECHDEAHAKPQEWMWTYKAKWGRYLFSLILPAFGKKKVEEAPVIDVEAEEVS